MVLLLQWVWSYFHCFSQVWSRKWKITFTSSYFHCSEYLFLTVQAAYTKVTYYVHIFFKSVNFVTCVLVVWCVDDLYTSLRGIVSPSFESPHTHISRTPLKGIPQKFEFQRLGCLSCIFGKYRKACSQQKNVV